MIFNQRTLFHWFSAPSEKYENQIESIILLNQCNLIPQLKWIPKTENTAPNSIYVKK